MEILSRFDRDDQVIIRDAANWAGVALADYHPCTSGESFRDASSTLHIGRTMVLSAVALPSFERSDICERWPWQIQLHGASGDDATGVSPRLGAHEP